MHAGKAKGCLGVMGEETTLSSMHSQDNEHKGVSKHSVVSNLSISY